MAQPHLLVQEGKLARTRSKAEGWLNKKCGLLLITFYPAEARGDAATGRD